MARKQVLKNKLCNRWYVHVIFALFCRIQTKFCQAKASNQGAAQREQVLKDLTAGFDIYIELKSNLEEGTKVGTFNWNVACNGCNWT